MTFLLYLHLYKRVAVCGVDVSHTPTLQINNEKKDTRIVKIC